MHDPQIFLARARPVLQLYATAQALLQAGTWGVCVDEKTSLQAREAEAAPGPGGPGQVARQSLTGQDLIPDKPELLAKLRAQRERCC